MPRIAARRYHITLPAVFNSPRRGLSVDWWHRLSDDPAVVAFYAYDPTHVYRLGPIGDAGIGVDTPTTEARTRVLVIDTAPRAGIDAAAAEKRIAAFVADLANLTPYAGEVVVTSWEVDVEVIPTKGKRDTGAPTP
jgi:hypothetical protein